MAFRDLSPQRAFGGLSLAAACGLCLLLLLGCAPAGPSPQLVLLVTIDTLRADHLGSYGYDRARTPHLDQLAADGLRFEQATTASNNTLPAHPSILTGRYPRSLGVPRNSFPLPRSEITLAQRFRESGYETAAFISGSALESSMGLSAGFDTYDEALGIHELDQEQRRAQDTTDAVLCWLKAREPGRAFVWLHYFDPHYPYTPPPPFDSLYGDDYEGPADGSMEYLSHLWSKGSARIRPSHEDLQRLVDLYDGEIAYTDGQLGRLLATIDELGLRDEAIVAVTADHGESLTEHDYLFNHGLHLYEPSLRVPLLVRLPSSYRVEARVISASVQTLDPFPTLLEAAGIRGAATQDRPPLDGVSLMPLIRGGDEAVREHSFAESSRPWSVEKQHPAEYRNARKAHMVMEGPWKLIATPYSGKRELYHTGRDPQELHNAIADEPEVLARLEQVLSSWRAKVRAATSRSTRKTCAA